MLVWLPLNWKYQPLHFVQWRHLQNLEWTVISLGFATKGLNLHCKETKRSSSTNPINNLSANCGLRSRRQPQDPERIRWKTGDRKIRNISGTESHQIRCKEVPDREGIRRTSGHRTKIRSCQDRLRKVSDLLHSFGSLNLAAYFLQSRNSRFELCQVLGFFRSVL